MDGTKVAQFLSFFACVFLKYFYDQTASWAVTMTGGNSTVDWSLAKLVFGGI